jgi:hypothetical protein
MGFWVTRARWSKEDFQPVLRRTGRRRPVEPRGGVSAPVLALRGVLRGAPPSAARLRRDGSRKRKRQKIASQEQCLLLVQRSRIAANISSITLAGHAARSCKPTEPAGKAWSALRRARIRFRTPRRIQNRPRGNDRRPAEWVRPCDFFACPAVRWNVRAGFFNLSRDGGLELFKLLNRSRRSSFRRSAPLEPRSRQLAPRSERSVLAWTARSALPESSECWIRNPLRRPEKSTSPSRIVTT